MKSDARASPKGSDRGCSRTNSRLVGRTLAVVLVGAALLGTVVCVQAGALETPAGEPIGLQKIFAFLFLMLGPLKILGPFVKMTQGADQPLCRQLAVRAFFVATITVLVAGLVGQKLLSNFGVPLNVLTLAGAIILFLVALQVVLEQFSPPEPGGAQAAAPTLKLAAQPLAFPTIVTPYGVAAVIIFMAISDDVRGKLTIAAVLLGVMLLNLLFMLYARPILRWLGMPLQIFGVIIGVIQVALALQIILVNLGALGVIGPGGG
ncbi:MAG: MarC family protein [Chromatiales bacterium]